MRVADIGNYRPAHSTENELRRAMVDGLGWDVLTFQEDECDFRDVTSLAMEFGADFLLWTRTWTTLDTDAQRFMLKACTAVGIPTVGYHLDRWIGLSREHEIHEHPMFRCDLVCTADGGHDAEFAEAGINHRWFPPAVSEFECVPGRFREEYASDIAFVGSWSSYHPEWSHRFELVEWLRDNYGERVKFWPERGQPAVRLGDLRDLYASVKVVVGDSCLVPNADGSPVSQYFSDRIPETIGRGGFLLHPRVPGVTDGELYTSGVHLCHWELGDWERLRSQIDESLRLGSIRQAIANDGRSHVLAEHTYTVRMRQLLELLRDEGMVA